MTTRLLLLRDQFRTMIETVSPTSKAILELWLDSLKENQVIQLDIAEWDGKL